MPSTPTEPDDYVIARLQEALAHELNELDVTVTITAGGVFLTGTVTVKERSKDITELVQRELPGVDVHNDVGVASLAEPESAEELQ